MDVTKPNDTIVNNLNNTTNANTDTNKDENEEMDLIKKIMSLPNKIKFKSLDEQVI